MGENLFINLPHEIIINILSRLPTRSILISKCVCKPWLNLLETDDFVNHHLSKSVPTLAVQLLDGESNPCTVYEFEDGDEADAVDSSHGRPYNELTKFDFPHSASIEGSANGLLLLYKLGSYDEVLYICNPITRHYVELCFPEEFAAPCLCTKATYMFGVSRITNHHKIVRINRDRECYLYTLGKGSSWRRHGIEGVRASLLFKYEDFIFSTFVDGNLYWEVTESSWSYHPLIACFDLETECFSSFSAPALRGGLAILRDCLCFCECDDEIVMWLMKDYGVEKSWRKEYVISQGPVCDGYQYDSVYPIKVFRNGDILMMWENEFIFYYSNKTKTIRQIVDNGMFDAKHDFINLMAVTPSFLSLKGLAVENVISF